MNDKYISRLLVEWQLHGKIIIAVDFDDTISPWKMHQKEDCDRVISVVSLAHKAGAYVVIFTACKLERFPEIRNYCMENGLEIDSINESPLDLPYGNQNKIYANIFIDDRAGMDQALDILTQATKLKTA